MATTAVRDAMTSGNIPASRSGAPRQGIIAAPHAGDVLAGVFRTAFAATDEVPDDFRAILARLDRCETGRH